MCVCVPQASQTVSPVDLQAHFAHARGDGPRHLALTWRLGSLRAMGIYRLLGLGVGLVKGQWSKMNSRRIQEISSILYIYIYIHMHVYIYVYMYIFYTYNVYMYTHAYTCSYLHVMGVFRVTEFGSVELMLASVALLCSWPAADVSWKTLY